MKSSGVIDSLIKTVKKNYKFILILLLLVTVVILIIVFSPPYRNTEYFTNNDPQTTNIDVSIASSKSPAAAATDLYGRYIDYSIISPAEVYTQTKDSMTSITYKLPSVMRVTSIGFINDNDDKTILSGGDIKVKFDAINSDNIIEEIGDIGAGETLTTIPSEITISANDIHNVHLYTSIIRNARTVTNKVNVVTDTITVKAVGASKLPCKFLTHMCIFGTAVDDDSEKDLYVNDINNTNSGLKIYNYFPTATINTLTVDNKKVFELAFKNDTNPTQISARAIKFTSASKLYTVAPPTAPVTVPTNCDITTKPNYITASISYKNDILNNADLILPNDYKLVTLRNTATNPAVYNYYIFFPVPLIMNSVKIAYDIPAATATPTATAASPTTCDFSNVSVIGRLATAADLDDYNNYVEDNTGSRSAGGKSRESMSSLDVCPSDVSEIIKIQKNTQDICENIEYQDKIKAEKAKLEREKVYLVKLKTQFDEIKSLQDTINTLDARKQQRNENADSVRLLQYQQQKAQAAQLRDAAINRSSQYDKNKLYFDVNLEKTTA